MMVNHNLDQMIKVLVERKKIRSDGESPGDSKDTYFKVIHNGEERASSGKE